MITWVFYDISDNKSRNKAVKFCKQSGIYRVQYSVFLGEMERNRFDTLQLQLDEIIDHERDKVYMLPMSKQELKSCVLLGQAFDKKLITGKVKSLFL